MAVQCNWVSSVMPSQDGDGNVKIADARIQTCPTSQREMHGKRKAVGAARVQPSEVTDWLVHFVRGHIVPNHLPKSALRFGGLFSRLHLQLALAFRALECSSAALVLRALLVVIVFV